MFPSLVFECRRQRSKNTLNWWSEGLGVVLSICRINLAVIFLSLRIWSSLLWSAGCRTFLRPHGALVAVARVTCHMVHRARAPFGRTPRPVLRARAHWFCPFWQNNVPVLLVLFAEQQHVPFCARPCFCQKVWKKKVGGCTTSKKIRK